MKNPKISIIIPVYNGSNYLSEAIDSALAQTYTNIEIIVVNDGSNDGGKTEEIALSYGDKIRYYAKENGGSSSALNMGIRNMTGDYFSWLSHDDLYVPEKLEQSVKRINDEVKSNQVIICGSELIDKDGRVVYHPTKKRKMNYSSEEMLLALSKDFGINGCSVLIPKTIIEKIGFFDENLVYLNDYDYWYRLALNNCLFTCFNDKLVKTRMHDGQVSIKKANLFKKECAELDEKIASELLSDVNSNLNKIVIFIKKAARNQSNETVKRMLKALDDNKVLQIRCTMQAIGNILYGKSINLLKKTYKKIFLKR